MRLAPLCMQAGLEPVRAAQDRSCIAQVDQTAEEDEGGHEGGTWSQNATEHQTTGTSGYCTPGEQTLEAYTADE